MGANVVLWKSSSVSEDGQVIRQGIRVTLCQILYIVLGTYVQKILNPSGMCRWTSKLQRSCSVKSLELDERPNLKLLWLLCPSNGRDGR